MTTGVGEVRMGTTAGDLTAIPGVSEKKIERSSGHVTAVSDLADVAVTTGVSAVSYTHLTLPTKLPV